MRLDFTTTARNVKSDVDLLHPGYNRSGDFSELYAPRISCLQRVLIEAFGVLDANGDTPGSTVDIDSEYRVAVEMDDSAGSLAIRVARN